MRRTNLCGSLLIGMVTVLGGFDARAIPGLVISTGTETAQLTLAFGVPMIFAWAEAGSILGTVYSNRATGFGYVLRPTIAVELPIGETTMLALFAQVRIGPNSVAWTSVVPTIGFGFGW